jgi:hypothetical protein
MVETWILMTKKKAKNETAKAAKAKPVRRQSAGKNKKEFNPAEVRKEISAMVGLEAKSMAAAVIGDGKKGQLATVKYLFDFASIFPSSTDGSYATTDEDCLAKTLLDRLDLPDKPVGRDDEDEPVRTANPLTGAATGTDASGKETSKQDHEQKPIEPKTETNGEEGKVVSALV